MNKWPYVAAMVDAEGSICIYKCSQYNVDLVIPNTSLKLMKWLVSNFGGRYNSFQPESLHGFNRKVLYRWRPSGKKNRINFLLGIIPYLIIKLEQAKLVLEFERLGYGEQEKREELRKKVSALNRSESVTTNTLDNEMLLDNSDSLKIESVLHSDMQSGPVVIQESQ